MRAHDQRKQACHISAAEAASLVWSGDWIDYGITLCQPDIFDKALAARKMELTNVKIRSCLSMKPRAVLESDPEGEHFRGSAGTFLATTARSMTPELAIIPLTKRRRSDML